MSGVATMGNYESTKNNISAANMGLAIVGGAILLMVAFMLANSTKRGGPEFEPEPLQLEVAGSDSAKRESRVNKGPVSARLRLAQGAVRAGRKRSVFAEMIVSGNEKASTKRAPLAVAIVLDRSGSMSGVKIRAAKDAVLDMVSSMRPTDRVAFIAYNHEAKESVSLMEVREARRMLRRGNNSFTASGGTNIPDGLDLGIRALRSAPERFIKRIVLFSDGLDGSGESLDDIASTMRREMSRGVTISALGIGTDYDETFMSTVAEAGGGNYAFLGNRRMLDRFIAMELDESANSVAEKVAVDLYLPRGMRVERVIGTTYEQNGRTLHLNYGSLSAGAERRAVLELVVDAREPGMKHNIDYRLSFVDVGDWNERNIRGSKVCVHIVKSQKEALKSRHMSVWGDVQAAVIDDEQEKATIAYRRGDRAKAKKITSSNMARLRRVKKDQVAAGAAPSESIDSMMSDMEEDMDNFAYAPESKKGKAAQLFQGAKRRARKKTTARSAKKPRASGSSADALDGLEF